MTKRAITVTIDDELFNSIKQTSEPRQLSKRVEQLLEKGLQAESTTGTGKDLLKDLFRVARALNEKARAKEIIFNDTKPIEQTEPDLLL